MQNHHAELPLFVCLTSVFRFISSRGSSAISPSTCIIHSFVSRACMSTELLSKKLEAISSPVPLDDVELQSVRLVVRVFDGCVIAFLVSLSNSSSRGIKPSKFDFDEHLASF